MGIPATKKGEQLITARLSGHVFLSSTHIPASETSSCAYTYSYLEKHTHQIFPYQPDLSATY
jgi:hypothetical protein